MQCNWHLVRQNRYCGVRLQSAYDYTMHLMWHYVEERSVRMNVSPAYGYRMFCSHCFAYFSDYRAMLVSAIY